jgi:gamma-glutamyl:cysteine ligase YbdK (ATP-grasp superfamily)
VGTLEPNPSRFGLFDAYGVEIELMLVDVTCFDVKPICDELIASVAGHPASEIERGEVAWSNEVALHVLEIKTSQPAPSLGGLAARFREGVRDAARALAPLGARLMPGGMHPWMDPHQETRLWPHEYTDVYRAFDRIFGCSGHGWANLQSTHLNLPFDGDREFASLHAAIRIVLPLVPALAASSPFQDGGLGPGLDSRLVAYRSNAARIPSVAGRVIPEAVFSRAEYEHEILGRIYSDLAPHDPEGVLRHEWVNARGAIARFERGTIEIRLIDSQECPTGDLAVVAAIVSLVRALTVGRLAERDLHADPDTDSLAHLLGEAAVHADRAVARDRRLLRALGVRKDEVPLGELWDRMLDAHPPDDPQREWTAHLQEILRRGPLARRMLAAVGMPGGPGARSDAPGKLAGPLPREALRSVAAELCRCLEHDATFTP